MNIHGSELLQGNNVKRGNGKAKLISVTGLADAKSIYENAFIFEDIENSKDMNWDYDVVDGSPINYQYLSSSNLILNGDYFSEQDFILLRSDKLFLNNFSLSVNNTERGASGHRSHAQTNLFSTFPWMTRGGDAYTTTNGSTTYRFDGGIGFSGGCYDSYYGTYGKGGGAVVIIAEEITQGMIEARGHGISHDGSNYSYGGGGIILIFCKRWNGTVGLDVSPMNSNAQEGSYAIIKINDNGTETLMVHSQNGVSAPLNGQDPQNGTDASIAW